jgi:hypothetical protein
MSATALKTEGVRTPLANPICAKMSPTSPRGIIAAPDERLAPVEPHRRIAGDELADHTGRDQRTAHGQRARITERPHVDGCADHGEEHRHHEVADGGGRRLDLLALRRLVEDEPRREGADDGGRPDQLGDVGEPEGERQAEHDEGAGAAHLRDRAEDRRHDEAADEQPAPTMNAHRDARGAQHAAGRHPGTGGHAADDAQDHEPDDVVEDGGAEHHLPLAGLELYRGR